MHEASKSHPLHFSKASENGYMAGLLTCAADRAFPTRRSVAKVFCSRDTRHPDRRLRANRHISGQTVLKRIQQRVCSGFSPDSLFILHPEQGDRTPYILVISIKNTNRTRNCRQYGHPAKTPFRSYSEVRHLHIPSETARKVSTTYAISKITHSIIIHGKKLTTQPRLRHTSLEKRLSQQRFLFNSNPFAGQHLTITYTINTLNAHLYCYKS